MAILVTGGAGYIGSHTVRQLRERGDDVVVYDSLRTGFRSMIGDTQLLVGDVTDAALLAETFRRHDITAIVHFAARKSVGESMEHPAAYFERNVGGTATLIEQARLAGVQRFVFSSSCSVYGTPASLPVDESAPLQPESVYAQSKLMCEQMLRWYAECHGFQSVSLRYFNAAGAHASGEVGEDWSNSQNLVPLVMKAILGRRGKVEIFGTDYPTPDGTAIRDYIHVDDLADAHLRSLDYLAAGGASVALNVGTGTGSSVRQVIDASRVASGRDVPFAESPRRAGDPVAVWADNRLVTSTLGWRPRFGLDEIVESAWRWHSSHPDGIVG